MTDFGEIVPVDIRKIWPHEAADFTPWLVDNIDRLGRALGMDIEVQEREAGVGDFSLDIKAKDLGSGRTIVIENQLTPTDHDHLGKLLTYAGGFDAGVLVWIAKELRDEHRKALEWLNEHTGADVSCFGVIIEVIRIDNSKPALNFKPVVMPNEWQKSKSSGGAEASARGEAYRAYFQQLIDELRVSHKFTGAKVGQPQSWYAFASGVSGIVLSNSFALGGKLRVEVYIDTEDKDRNKQLFDELSQQRAAIEQEYGASLAWERLDDKRACRIAEYRDGAITDAELTRTELMRWSVDGLLKLKKVIVPRARVALNKTTG